MTFQKRKNTLNIEPLHATHVASTLPSAQEAPMRHRVLFTLLFFLCSFLLSANVLSTPDGTQPPGNFMKNIEIVNDPKFILVTHFEINVPKSYTHEEQLDGFRFRNGPLFKRLSASLSDKTWAEAAEPLKPGKTYEVKIFSFAEEVTYEDCKTFCESKGALRAGAQGLSLLWEMKKERLPLDKALLSFNNLDAYPTETKEKEHIYILPFIARFSNGSWWLELITVKNKLNSDYCLVCFFEKHK